MFIKSLGVFTHPINDNGAESNKLRRGNDQKKGILEKRSPQSFPLVIFINRHA